MRGTYNESEHRRQEKGGLRSDKPLLLNDNGWGTYGWRRRPDWRQKNPLARLLDIVHILFQPRRSSELSNGTHLYWENQLRTSKCLRNFDESIHVSPISEFTEPINCFRISTLCNGNAVQRFPQYSRRWRLIMSPRLALRFI